MSKAYLKLLKSLPTNSNSTSGTSGTAGSLTEKYSALLKKSTEEHLGKFVESDDEVEEDLEEDAEGAEGEMEEDMMGDEDMEMLGEGDEMMYDEDAEEDMELDEDMEGDEDAADADEDAEKEKKVPVKVDDEDDGTYEDDTYDLKAIDKIDDDSELDDSEDENDDDDAETIDARRPVKRTKKNDAVTAALLKNDALTYYEDQFNKDLTPKQLRFLSAASSFVAVSSKIVGQKLKKTSLLASAPQRNLQRVDAVCALGTCVDKYGPDAQVEDEDEINPAHLSEVQRLAREFTFFTDRKTLSLPTMPVIPPATVPITVDNGVSKTQVPVAPFTALPIRPRLAKYWTDSGVFCSQVYDAQKEHALNMQTISHTLLESQKQAKVKKAQAAGAPCPTMGTPLQRMLLPLFSSYTDVMLASPSPCMPLPSWGELQDAYLAHCINHVFTTRDRVIAHNEALSRKAAKEREAALLRKAEKLNDAERNALLAVREEQLRAQLKGNKEQAKEAAASLAVLQKTKRSHKHAKKERQQARMADDAEFAQALANPSLIGAVNLSQLDDPTAKYRDQGFTRPKVLIVAPTRSRAYEVVLRLIELLPPNQRAKVLNLGRFHEEFGDLDEEYVAKDNRPLDYKLTFNGNHDDCFKFGLSFSNTAVKLFSSLYSSDIVIGSPLGLKLLVGNEGDSDNERKADFLSSIEVCVLDHAHVFNMQNMDHLTDVMSSLNGLPHSTKDVDFSRVRSWYLDGHARFYRQTIVCAAHWSSQLLNVFHRYCENKQGRIRIRPAEYAPVLRHVRPKVKHMFMRLDGLGAPEEVADAKFELWKTDIWPKIKEANTEGHTVIFIPSYLDFVRVRNYLKSRYVKFGILCEFTDPRMVGAVRTSFYNGKTKFILTTERFHFFNRISIRSVRHVVWYGLPQHPHYYFDMLNYIDGSGNSAKCIKPPSSFALYTKQDALALERIVGSDQSVEMLTSKQHIHFLSQ